MRVVTEVRVLCDPGPTDDEGQAVRYHLQARRFGGPLYHPTRNDSVTETSDNLDDLKVRANKLRELGYTTWLFREGLSNLPGADGRKLIEERGPMPIHDYVP